MPGYEDDLGDSGYWEGQDSLGTYWGFPSVLFCKRKDPGTYPGSQCAADAGLCRRD